MKKTIDFESVLFLIDRAISPTYLNSTQEIVLREVWNGKTYTKMACDYNYDPEYIKTVGCNLWQTLSQAFDEQINKSNFVPFMRQKVSRFIDEQINQPPKEHSSSNLSVSQSKQQYCNWTTAPSIKHFVGRNQELSTLDSWSRDPDCRLIVVSGMTGAGKTSLVTEFANSIKEDFDYVIWFSLSQLPSLIELLNKYLKIIAGDSDTRESLKPQELSFLLSEFIDCLKQQKILLVLDSLQSILEVSQTSVSYRKDFEAYGQFLRSVISTNHQSLLVTTSSIKPKLLEYYASNQVRFLDLKGFDRQTTIRFLNRADAPLAELELIQLSENLRSNPQLLKIAHNHLDLFSEEDSEQVIEDLSLLKAIKDLMEQELSYLSNLDKEIIYWLAISCFPLSLDELAKQTKHSRSKIEFSRSVKSLIERSLIIQQEQSYALMPIMKIYLRRKLVKQAL